MGSKPDPETSLAGLVESYLSAADAEVERWKGRAVSAINELTERREEVRQLKKERSDAVADLARVQSGERERLDQERIERLVEECAAAWELVAKLEAKAQGRLPETAPVDTNVSSEEVERRIRETGCEEGVVEKATKDLASRMSARLDPEVMHALARIYHAKLNADKSSEYSRDNWWNPVDCAFFHLFHERRDIEADIKAEMKIAAGMGKPDHLYGDEPEYDDEDEDPEDVD